jgi:hypothetical protein
VHPILAFVFVVVTAFAFAVTPSVTTSAQELSADGEKAGSKIALRGLKRDGGGTVTLRFQVVNDGNNPLHLYSVIGSSLDGNAHLLDAANKKKYLVVKDSSGKCECSPIRGEATKDNPINLWVRFPAPPDNVEKVTVVVTGFEPIESAPIAR